MATQKGSGTRKVAAKRPVKKGATRRSAPTVTAEPAPPPQPPAAPSTDRLTEVARTIGSTMGAIAVTAKRALGQTAGKK